MIIIGIDPHKHTHTAVAVDQHEQPIGQLTILAGPQVTARLLAWAEQWPERRWAVESARGLGYHLAQQLVGAGEQVSDVHPKLATRVRLLDRGHGRKTDQADARSVALVALRTPTLTLVGVEDDLPAVVRLLADRRDELNQERRRVTNRLHRLLRDLVAGGAPTPLTVEVASRLLRRVRATTAADQQRKALAHELLADLRRLDRQLAANRSRCQELLAVRPSRLLDVFGISAVLAVKLIGHSGAITRFHSPDHYASYTGTAPIDASSGPNTRQRVNRGGNRPSTPRSTWSPAPRSAGPVPAVPTTSANSPKARPPTRPFVPSSGRSSRSSTEPSSPTTTPTTLGPNPPPVDIQAL